MRPIFALAGLTFDIHDFPILYSAFLPDRRTDPDCNSKGDEMDNRLQSPENLKSSAPEGCDFDEQYFLLNYGTRLLTAFSDKEILIDIGLETLADFSRGNRVAIMSLDENHEKMKVDGVFRQSKSDRRPNTVIPIQGSALENIIFQKVVSVYPLVVMDEVPIPAEDGRAGGEKCLCLPLIGASFQDVGLATIEIPEGHHLTFLEMQQLRILSTVLAISLENAKLFAQVIHDGLTDLYTRRYYEIRMAEELEKLKRNRGCLSIILFDLDDFKKINDSFGHLMGDEVLRQFGTLMRDHVRKGSTLVSRYGGEEFVLLMPDAHIDEAVHLAHRISALCSGHPFGDGARKVSITVSGGVAFTDHTESLSPGDLFQRADTALYQAKEDGRNRVVVWSDPASFVGEKGRSLPILER